MGTSAKIIFFAFLQFVLSSIYTHFLCAQLVSDFRVNDNTNNYAQYAAKVGCDVEGNFVVVWYDERITENPRICGQIFNQNAQRLGNNFQINNDQYQVFPSLYVRKNGSFIVAWSVIQTKFRLFNRYGIPISDEIIVADSTASITSISADSSGNFVITWEQYSSSFTKQIYCQIINSTGKLIGNRIKVNDDTGSYQHKNPAISVRRDGSFIITWEDSRPPATESAEDIYMQMYSKYGTPIGVNVKVSDDTVKFNKQSYPKISSDTSGRFCISFSNFNINEVQTDVECQLYNYDGSRFGNNFKIASRIIDEFNAAIYKKENGEIASGFSVDLGFRSRPYFQRINSSGTLIGEYFEVSDQVLFINQYYSDIVVWNNRIISLWSDERNGNFDVFCNIRSFSNPDSTVGLNVISTEVPIEFKLFQNFPNPFNSQTNIVFEVIKRSAYTLEIYNSLGIIISRFIYSNLNPGKYNITYDASGLSSGVYYYSMNYGGSNSVKKFILVK